MNYLLKQSKHRKKVIKFQYIIILILLCTTVFFIQHKEIKTIVKKVQLSDTEVRQRYMLLCTKELVNRNDINSVLKYTRTHGMK